jgi:hypothetical protein
MLCIGIAGSLYQAVELRFYIPVHARHGQENVAGLAARAWAWREGFNAMDRTIPIHAVVQYNITQPSENFVFAELQNVGRQTAVGLPGCGVGFGGSADECAAIEAEAEELFPFSGNLSATRAQGLCRDLGVGYLIASRWDSVWGNPRSWVWTLPLVTKTDSVRVLSCHAGE